MRSCVMEIPGTCAFCVSRNPRHLRFLCVSKSQALTLFVCLEITGTYAFCVSRNHRHLRFPASGVSCIIEADMILLHRCISWFPFDPHVFVFFIFLQVSRKSDTVPRTEGILIAPSCERKRRPTYRTANGRCTHVPYRERKTYPLYCPAKNRHARMTAPVSASLVR